MDLQHLFWWLRLGLGLGFAAWVIALSGGSILTASLGLRKVLEGWSERAPKWQFYPAMFATGVLAVIVSLVLVFWSDHLSALWISASRPH